MSEEMTQLSAFPDEFPDEPVVAPRAEVEGTLVPRPPGWVLVSSKNGPKGFHRVRTVAELGTIVTVCGLKGRRITEDAREIILCPECENAS